MLRCVLYAIQAVEEDVRSAVDVKEEEVDKLSYSVVHSGGWAVSNEGMCSVGRTV